METKTQRAKRKVVKLACIFSNQCKKCNQSIKYVLILCISSCRLYFTDQVLFCQWWCTFSLHFTGMHFIERNPTNVSVYEQLPRQTVMRAKRIQSQPNRRKNPRLLPHPCSKRPGIRTKARTKTRRQRKKVNLTFAWALRDSACFKTVYPCCLSISGKAEESEESESEKEEKSKKKKGKGKKKKVSQIVTLMSLPLKVMKRFWSEC